MKVLMIAFWKDIWWAIFVDGSELPNLTLWHDMPTILNGVSASRPTFANLPTFILEKNCEAKMSKKSWILLKSYDIL